MERIIDTNPMKVQAVMDATLTMVMLVVAALDRAYDDA